MTSEITLFVNPTAGGGRGARAARTAAAALRDAGFHVDTVTGDGPEDALSRARTAVEEGTGALVAVGGDGMANLALQAVVGTGTPSAWWPRAPATTSPARSACRWASPPPPAG